MGSSAGAQPGVSRAAIGGEEWAWPHMLRVLCRLESDQDFADDAHGTSGPVPVVRWRRDELLPMQHAFLAAVNAHGIPWIDDMNAPDASGIGAIPMNRQDGLRMVMLTGDNPTTAHRVILEGGRAVGVEFAREAQLAQVRGTRIVLSAGALQSPSLLMRSGIGPAAHLADMGIACTVALSGVGENLMDHQGTAVFMVPREGLAPTDDRVCQLGARYSSSSALGVDDMWLSMWSSWELAEFPDMQAAMGVPAISAVIAGVHDPLSRGTVRLRSSDPSVRPAVDFAMLSHPDDLSRLVEGLQVAMALAASDEMAALYQGIGLLDATQADDRDALEAYIRSTVGGWYHATGTCRMGADPDDGAVVDGQLRVFGVDRLHVVDASVMPTVVRAPTNLTSIAIGERAAELLR